MSKIQEEPVFPVKSVEVLKRVNALVKIQEEHNGLNEQLQKELAEIEKKYEALFQPLYAKRSTIVSGSYEPTQEESQPTEPVAAEGLKASEEKGVPAFWHTALMNHSHFNRMINSDLEAEPLSYLVNIQITETDNVLKAEFIFAENPFFSNTSIVKTITFAKEAQEIESIETTPVQWKEGKNFTVKKVTKKVKGKGKGKKPVVTTQVVDEPVECLFADFLAPVGLEDAEEEELDQMNFLQYQLVVTLKDIIIPDAVTWFLGKGVEEQDDEDEYGNYMDFDGDDMEDGMDDDDDDEDDAPKPTRGPKSVPAVPPQDCKQQ